MVLVGTADEEFFVQENGKLYVIKEKEKIVICNNENLLYSSIVKDNNKSYLITFANAIPGGFLGGSARRSAFTGSIRYSRSRAFWQYLSVNISSSRISSRASTLFFMDVSRNRNPHFLLEEGRGILSMSADLSRRQAKMPQYLLTKYSIYSIINYRNRRF